MLDVNRIQKALQSRGLRCSKDTAEMLWHEYSDSLHAVSWQYLPDTDDEICTKIVGDMRGIGWVS